MRTKDSTNRSRRWIPSRTSSSAAPSSRSIGASVSASARLRRPRSAQSPQTSTRLSLWKGWDVYLRLHEIGTHSILGSVAIAWPAATLVYLLKRGSRYPALVLAASVGAISHVLFDIISGATIKIGWPFLQWRARLPLVAMADPWLIAICATGAVSLWVLRRRAFAVAVAVVAAIATFLALKGILMTAAVSQWRAATIGDIIVHHAVEASWSSLTEWDISDRTPHTLRKWHVNAVGAPGVVVLDTVEHRLTSCRGVAIVRHRPELSVGARFGICRDDSV